MKVKCQTIMERRGEGPHPSPASGTFAVWSDVGTKCRHPGTPDVCAWQKQGLTPRTHPRPGRQAWKRRTPVQGGHPVKISAQARAPSAWLYSWACLCSEIVDKLLNISELTLAILKMGMIRLPPAGCDVTWKAEYWDKSYHVMCLSFLQPHHKWPHPERLKQIPLCSLTIHLTRRPGIAYLDPLLGLTGCS